MTACTDDERRRVAERLRGLTSNVHELRKSYESEGFSILCDDQADYYQICHAVAGYLPPEHMHPCDYEELHARLADLIGPAQDQFRDPTKMVDREALLALAGDLEKKADKIIQAAQDSRFTGLGPRMCEAKHEACKWRGIARRIREACGEVA